MVRRVRAWTGLAALHTCGFMFIMLLQSIMEMNGAAIVAMCGKNCVGIAS